MIDVLLWIAITGWLAAFVAVMFIIIITSLDGGL